MILRALPLLALFGCSFSALDPSVCTENSQCRDAFGLGHVCGDAGLCTDLAAERRCVTTYPADLLVHPEQYRDAVLIGSIFDARAELEETQTVRLAVKQVDDADGLAGRGFGLVQCSCEDNPLLDDRSPEEAAEYTAAWLSDAIGVSAIIGPDTSELTEIAFAAAEPGGVLMMSPGARRPGLTGLDGTTKSEDNPGLLWRTVAPDSVQGQALAADVARQIPAQSGKVGVLFEAGLYGQGVAEGLLAGLSSTGFQALDHRFASTAERDAAVAAAAGLHVDALVFVGVDAADAAGFLDRASAYDTLADIPLFLSDTARDASLLSLATDDAEALFPRVRGTAPAAPTGDVYEQFVVDFEGEYGATPTAGAAYAYDAAWLVFAGTAWSFYQEGGISGIGAARGLRRVSGGTRIELGARYWSSVSGGFQDGSSLDLVGASGELAFDPATGEIDEAIEIWTLDASGFSTVDRDEP